ncbi:hypothetical protein ACIG3E_39845 [Streptomyces sp. NPDC053474]|uniref:bestrophin-like domain n=1 Tax=Streptomyces sp. NPDC053474 TaxID=3365704 RepID=UPI0037D723C7
MRSYVHHVVTTEWPTMARREPLGQRGWRLLDGVRNANRLPGDATVAQHAASQEVLAQVSALDEARRGREGDIDSGLSPVLWLGSQATSRASPSTRPG